MVVCTFAEILHVGIVHRSLLHRLLRHEILSYSTVGTVLGSAHLELCRHAARCLLHVARCVLHAACCMWACPKLCRHMHEYACSLTYARCHMGADGTLNLHKHKHVHSDLPRCAHACVILRATVCVLTCTCVHNLAGNCLEAHSASLVSPFCSTCLCFCGFKAATKTDNFLLLLFQSKTKSLVLSSCHWVPLLELFFCDVQFFVCCQKATYVAACRTNMTIAIRATYCTF